MKNEYRLIQVIESVDNIIREEIEIFELTPIDYNFRKSGYNFNPEPSAKNHFFIYEKSENMASNFLNNPEEIKEMDLSQFELKVIKTPEGNRNTYFSENLAKKRKMFS